MIKTEFGHISKTRKWKTETPSRWQLKRKLHTFKAMLKWGPSVNGYKEKN